MRVRQASENRSDRQLLAPAPDCVPHLGRWGRAHATGWHELARQPEQNGVARLLLRLRQAV